MMESEPVTTDSSAEQPEQAVDAEADSDVVSATIDVSTEQPVQVKSKPEPAGRAITSARGYAEPRRLWLWLTILLLIGILVLSVAGLTTWNWVRGLPLFTSTSAAPAPVVTTLPVGRTISYAGLSFTVLNAQFAASFSDDAIHAGQAMARLNMRVANQTRVAIGLVYYDIARLLIPKQTPIAPTNVQLAAQVQPGNSVKGWLDFPVPTDARLSSLDLQLGSAALDETLVTLPLSGVFHPERYAGRHSPLALTIYYSFEGNTLTYHLNSIDARYSYNGSEAKAGKQFYILNFTVDNTNGSDVSPGFGFDYIRLVINGNNLPPIDNTLPYTFKANTHNTGGHVTYEAQAGMTSLTIAFLLQLVEGQDNYQVSL